MGPLPVGPRSDDGQASVVPERRARRGQGDGPAPDARSRRGWCGRPREGGAGGVATTGALDPCRSDHETPGGEPGRKDGNGSHDGFGACSNGSDGPGAGAADTTVEAFASWGVGAVRRLSAEQRPSSGLAQSSDRELRGRPSEGKKRRRGGAVRVDKPRSTGLDLS